MASTSKINEDKYEGPHSKKAERRCQQHCAYYANLTKEQKVARVAKQRQRRNEKRATKFASIPTTASSIVSSLNIAIDIRHKKSVKVDPEFNKRSRGIYTFRVQEKMYHYINDLLKIVIQNICSCIFMIQNMRLKIDSIIRRIFDKNPYGGI